MVPDSLLNRTYLTEPDESGQRFCAKIIQKIVEQIDADADAYKKRDEYTKFLVRVKGSKQDEIVAYNNIIKFLKDDSEDLADKLWSFKDIVGHEGPHQTGVRTHRTSCQGISLEQWQEFHLGRG